MLGLQKFPVYNNFSRVGNTANASTYLSLSEVIENGTLQDGTAQPFSYFQSHPGDVVALLGAESTKWLYGTIVLKYHSLDSSATPSVPRIREEANRMSKMCSGILVHCVNAYFATRKMYNSFFRATAPQSHSVASDGAKLKSM